MMKEIKEFNLAGKTFCFYFHKYNCHKEQSGVCSLTLENIQVDNCYPQFEKSNPKHCPYVYKLIKDQPSRMFPIYLYKYACGHYQTGQGQHRICISGNVKNEIHVLFEHIDDVVCGYCENPESHKLFTF